MAGISAWYGCKEEQYLYQLINIVDFLQRAPNHLNRFFQWQGVEFKVPAGVTWNEIKVEAKGYTYEAQRDQGKIYFNGQIIIELTKARMEFLKEVNELKTGQKFL